LLSLLYFLAGWLCQIRLTNPAEFETLLDEGAYKKLTDAAEH
jgi:glycine cleavage system H lipoate-binding protein